MAPTSCTLSTSPLPTVARICQVDDTAQTFCVEPLDQIGLSPIMGPYAFTVNEMNTDPIVVITPLTTEDAHKKVRHILTAHDHRVEALMQQHEVAITEANALRTRAIMLGL